MLIKSALNFSLLFSVSSSQARVSRFECQREELRGFTDPIRSTRKNVVAREEKVKYQISSGMMWICFAEERILFSIIWFYWKLICSILTLGRSSDTKERRKRDAIWIFDWKLLSRRRRRSGRHKKFLDIYFLSAHTHLAIVCWSKWSSLLCAANYRRRATSGRRLCCVNWIDCLTSTRLNYHCVEREKERFISAYKHFANYQDCRVSILENCVSWLTRTHERWYREEAPHSINRKVV